MLFAVQNGWRGFPGNEAVAERLLYALRCTLAACISYAIADRLWPQLPLWAPVSALVVSQHRWKQTEQFVSGLPLGTFVGAAIAVLAAMTGELLDMPLLGQIGLAVVVSAALAMDWTSARAAMWMSLIGVWLIDRVPGEIVTSAGWMMAEEVVLGSIIGGLLAVAFELVGPSRRRSSQGARHTGANRRLRQGQTRDDSRTTAAPTHLAA
jgi:uncharacterized membrane protein YccC